MTKNRYFRFTGFGAREQRFVRLVEVSGRPAREAKRFLASLRAVIRCCGDEPAVLRARYGGLLDSLTLDYEKQLEVKTTEGERAGSTAEFGNDALAQGSAQDSRGEGL